MDENDNEEEDNFPPVRFALTEKVNLYMRVLLLYRTWDVCLFATRAEPDKAVVRAEKRGRRRRKLLCAVKLNLDVNENDFTVKLQGGKVLCMDEENSTQLNQSKVGIILEGSVVMEDLANLPQAFCLLFGLIYCPALDYRTITSEGNNANCTQLSPHESLAQLQPPTPAVSSRFTDL
ncbi:unnamed protein product [Pleuronectes platessa]|uniref:Uncharacterized protein n=1 Tax=Pleuronectes platessa TaxID=8262 RepID=A0A9N7V6W6_PLEPL|nr:unnamed protein product [Pleuronectes platessa]